MNEHRTILTAYERARTKGVRAALVTIVNVLGSSYRRPGAKMLITEEGDISCAISGGCLERDVIQRACWAIHHSQARIVRYDTRVEGFDEQDSLIQSAGLGCEGIIDVFIDPAPEAHLKAIEFAECGRQTVEYTIALPDGTAFQDVLVPPVNLIIFGAGHDAVPVSRLSLELGWDTTVVDCRSAFPAPKQLFNAVTHFISCPLENLMERMRIPNESAMLIMTHNYEHDRLILKQIVGHPVKYIGLLGPRLRGARLLSDLNTEGIPALFDRIYFPTGLDIGAETPQAIALAMLAEVQAVLAGKEGGFLRKKTEPIHETRYYALRKPVSMPLVTQRPAMEASD
ncbi:MAG: XdhC family protein [Nitrospiria bacterium]